MSITHRCHRQAELRLSALPRMRDCVVSKVVEILDRREQYRQAVLTIERGALAARPCDRCLNPRSQHYFAG